MTNLSNNFISNNFITNKVITNTYFDSGISLSMCNAKCPVINVFIISKHL